MIRTTVVGSWPPEDRFRGALAHYLRGTLTAGDHEQLLCDVAEVAIQQQKACGLDEYTGGETSADSFILHFPKYLTGIEPTANTDAWDGRGDYRIVGVLDAPAGLGLAAAFRREKRIDPALAKVTIPGPSEIMMMIGPADRRRAAWPRAIELIRREIAACIDAGAQDVQLDLPHVAMGVADGWWSGDPEETIRAIFHGITGVRRSVHFCYGDFQAKTWTQNRHFQPLLSLIQQLGGVVDRTVDRVVLEFSLPEQWAQRSLLGQIPASMEVAVGIVDVKSPVVESVDELVVKIRELLTYVPAARLLICPSCGFGRRNAELAMGKAMAMVQAVQRVNEGL
ncbi:MAG: hypothetical protein R2911_16240 [Caldilineaceae bacterium]